MDKRIKSVDFLRGLAVVFMVLGHSNMLFPKREFGLMEEILYYIALENTAVFIIVSGMSSYFFFSNRIMREVKKKDIISITLKRAIFIFAVTTLIQIVIGLVYEVSRYGIIHWSMFHVIAISMIIFAFIPFLSKYLRIIAYVSYFILIFLIAHLILFFNITILFFLVGGGDFPILPWANFFLVGFFTGDIIINSSQHKIKIELLIFLLIGVILVIVWVLWAISFQYLFIFHFVWGIGAFLILFSFFYYLLDMRELRIYTQNRLYEWSKLAFSLYFIHNALIRGAQFLLDIIIRDIIRTGFLFYQFLILVACLILILDLFIRIWEKIDYKYGLEWCMRKFSQLSISFKKE